MLYLRAQCLDEAGQRDDAIKCYQSCLECIRNTVGFEDPRCLLVISDFSRLLKRVGKEKDAEVGKLFEEVLKVEGGRFGERHFLVADVHLAYAEALQDRGDAQGQAREARYALEIYEQSGSLLQRRRYVDCLRILADAYIRLGNTEKADSLLQKAQDARKAQESSQKQDK